MAAHAKAHESKRDARDFQDPRDGRAIRGFRGSFSGYERNRFFANVGAGQPYVECGFGLGVDYEHDGRAAAPIDFDGDGDLDLAVLSLQDVRMLQNDSGTDRHWIRIDTRATRSQPQALGAVVRIEAAGRKQVDRVRLTAGFHTQVTRELHFGLGGATRADVTVEWPSGETERFAGLAADNRYVLTEGTAKASVRSLPAWPEALRPRAVGAYSTKLRALDLKGRMRRLGWPGRAAVVNFWATWCEPCQRELPALAKLAAKVGKKVDIVAVAVETGDLDAVNEFAKKHGIQDQVRVANDALVKSYFGAEGKVALPTTFVFGPDGRLLRTFYREVEADDILTLLAPYDDAPPIEDLRYLATYYLHADRHEDARVLLSGRMDEAEGDAFLLNELAQIYLRLGQLDRARVLVEKALKEDPRDADIWATYGEVHGIGGDLKAAEKALDRGLAIDPTNARALNNKGMVYRQRKQYDEALEYFGRSLKAAPGYEKAQKNMDETMVEREGPPKLP